MSEEELNAYLTHPMLSSDALANRSQWAWFCACTRCHGVRSVNIGLYVERWSRKCLCMYVGERFCLYRKDYCVANRLTVLFMSA